MKTNYKQEGLAIMKGLVEQTDAIIALGDTDQLRALVLIQNNLLMTAVEVIGEMADKLDAAEVMTA